jgi:hypothetical protein
MVKANLKGKVIAEADRTEIAEQPLFSFQIAARGVLPAERHNLP